MADSKKQIEQLRRASAGPGLGYLNLAADTIERLEAERERDAAVLAELEEGLRRIRAENRYNLPARLMVIHQIADDNLRFAQHAQEQVEKPRCATCGSDDPSVCLDTELRKPKPGPPQPPSLGSNC